MDCRRCGLISLYVLLLTLLVQSRSVPPALSNCTDHKNRAESIAETLFKEADDLQRSYAEFHPVYDNSIPDKMPDSTVSGASITEMLQDMVLKNMLFSLHINKTEENQKESWNGTTSVENPLKTVKIRLTYLSSMLKEILHDLNISVPSAPPSLNFTHTYDNAKIEYGWGVIKALKAWLTRVQKVLKRTDVCMPPPKSSKVWKNEPVM